MPAYNTFDFDPPAPVALVTFVHPDTGQRMDNVPMLLDTGADASIVPQVVVTALGMSERTKAYEVTFLEGDTATLRSTHLQMKWLSFTFTGEFLVTQAAHGVIGRNILNNLRVVLDGPRQDWEIE